MKNKLEELIHQQLFIKNFYQEMITTQGRKQQDLTKSIAFFKEIEKQNKLINNIVKSSICKETPLETQIKSNTQLINSALPEEKQTVFADDDEVISHFQESLKLNRRLGELLAK